MVYVIYTTIEKMLAPLYRATHISNHEQNYSSENIRHLHYEGIGDFHPDNTNLV